MGNPRYFGEEALAVHQLTLARDTDKTALSIGIEMKDRRLSEKEANRKMKDFYRLCGILAATQFDDPVQAYDQGRLPVVLMREFDVFFDKWGTAEDVELCRGTAKN
jgi:hypothetical protein